MQFEEMSAFWHATKYFFQDLVEEGLLVARMQIST